MDLVGTPVPPPWRDQRRRFGEERSAAVATLRWGQVGASWDGTGRWGLGG